MAGRRTRKGDRVAGYIVHESASPVLPIAPTVVGVNDPYNSLAPVLRARVAAVVAEVVEPGEVVDASATDRPAQELGNGGIPVARPVLTETESEELPTQRVQLPRPRAIEFE